MAARRSRLQIKPNIAGKSSSKPGLGSAKIAQTTRGSEHNLSAPELLQNRTPVNKPEGTNDKAYKLLVEGHRQEDRISAEQAAGAAKAFSTRADKNSISDSLENSNSFKKSVQGQTFTRLKRFGLTIDTGAKNSKSQDDNSIQENQHTKEKKSPTHDKQNDDATSPAVKAGKTFTRRFSSNVPKASLKVTSPLTSPNGTKSNTSDPFQSLKSPLVSPTQSDLREQGTKVVESSVGKKSVLTGGQHISPSLIRLTEQSPKPMSSRPGKRSLQADSGPSVIKSPKRQPVLELKSPVLTTTSKASPKPTTPVKSPLKTVFVAEPIAVIKSPIKATYVAEPLEGSKSRKVPQSQLKAKPQPTLHRNKGAHQSSDNTTEQNSASQQPSGPRPNSASSAQQNSDSQQSNAPGTNSTTSAQQNSDSRQPIGSDSMPSVIQRLPFRSRFPKARPNIEALKQKSKGLTIPREENLSRPSSPLKSPKILKGASPMKLFQHQRPPTEEEKGQRLGAHDVDVSAPEGRKRHLSTSSISTVHSEVMPAFKTPADKNSMTIGDLIYYNPVKNPMSSVSTQKKKAKLEKEKEKENIESIKNTPAKDPGSSPPKNTPAKDTDSSPTNDEDDNDDMPVPQVKIGPDGSIIVNEESLIIQKPEEAPITEIIEETENTATYSSFKKPLSRTAWSEWETDKFYRALSYLGTDFSLMIKMFPNRTRYDIKTKFKREDKFNRSRIEDALKNKKPFDMTFFEREAELDKQEEKRKKKQAEEKLRQAKLQRLEKKKEKEKEKTPKPKENSDTRGPKESSEPVVRRGTRERKTRKIIYDDDEEELPDSLPVTPVKTSASSSPYKRVDSAPFIPPFCLSQEDDTDKDSLEEQVSMSDSEILSPQRPIRSQVTDHLSPQLPLRSPVTPRADEPITINPADFPPNTNIQITQDANNSPLVLVYHTTEDGKGDTVIHVYQLQNQTQSIADDQNTSANGEQAYISEQSDQPMEDSVTSDHNGLPFLIAEPTSDLSTVTSDGNFINVIDINASKVTTPKKGQSSSQDQSVYQVSIAPETVTVENEFRPSVCDKKFLDINVLSKQVGGKKTWKKS